MEIDHCAVRRIHTEKKLYVCTYLYIYVYYITVAHLIAYSPSVIDILVKLSIHLIRH